VKEIEKGGIKGEGKGSEREREGGIKGEEKRVKDSEGNARESERGKMRGKNSNTAHFGREIFHLRYFLIPMGKLFYVTVRKLRERRRKKGRGKKMGGGEGKETKEEEQGSYVQSSGTYSLH
jgi:hypothetical protein